MLRARGVIPSVMHLVVYRTGLHCLYKSFFKRHLLNLESKNIARHTSGVQRL